VTVPNRVEAQVVSTAGWLSDEGLDMFVTLPTDREMDQLLAGEITRIQSAALESWPSPSMISN
jgi:hypothetical protein